MLNVQPLHRQGYGALSTAGIFLSRKKAARPISLRVFEKPIRSLLFLLQLQLVRNTLSVNLLLS